MAKITPNWAYDRNELAIWRSRTGRETTVGFVNPATRGVYLLGVFSISLVRLVDTTAHRDYTRDREPTVSPRHDATYNSN